MNSASIGKRIRAHRKQKGWSMEQFAEKTGLSVTYMGMIERGEKTPKLETFITIANTLGVSADLLLADVLTTGYSIKSSVLTERIEKLDADEQERIYEVVETMLNHKKL